MSTPTAKGKEKEKGKPRGNYASTACLNCRRRKSRCDGDGTSTCSTCRWHSEECSYAVDGRKLSMQYVSALKGRMSVLEQEEATKNEAAAELFRRNQTLERRCLALERKLASLGISVSDTIESEMRSNNAATIEPSSWQSRDIVASSSGPMAIPQARTSGKRQAEDDGEHVSGDDEDWLDRMDNLTITDDGEAMYFGPSSSLSHGIVTAVGNLGATSPVTPPPINPCTGVNLELVDWSRNLPPNMGISRETHGSILDLFEAWFAPWCRVIDMYNFRRDLVICLSPDGPPRTSFYSPLLHNIILAYGCTLWKGEQVQPFPPVNRSSSSFVDVPPLGRVAETDSELAAAAFYHKARLLVESETERPMLSTVRGMLITGSVNASAFRPSLGFLYSGSGFRIASILGLNIDATKYVEKGTISAEVKAARDLTFYTCYVQERLWNLSEGRFLTTLGGNDHNIPLPPIDDREDHQPWCRPRIFRFPDGARPPLPTAPSWTSTCFHWTVRLALIQDLIIRGCYGLKPLELSQYTNFSLQLQEWSLQLPACLSLPKVLPVTPPPHVLTLHVTFQKTTMLLHRPFFLKKGELSSAKRCEDAAMEVVRLLELYEDAYGLEYAPLTSIHTTFIAGTCFLLSARNTHSRAPKRAKNSMEGLSSCLRALHKMAAPYPYALNTALILEALQAKWIPQQSPSATSDASLPSQWVAGFDFDFGSPPTTTGFDQNKASSLSPSSFSSSSLTNNQQIPLAAPPEAGFLTTDDYQWAQNWIPPQPNLDEFILPSYLEGESSNGVGRGGRGTTTAEGPFAFLGYEAEGGLDGGSLAFDFGGYHGMGL